MADVLDRELSLGNASFSAAILPFLTDQVIGATADELSTLVHWYVRTNKLVFGLSFTVTSLAILPNFNYVDYGIPDNSATCLDCY